MDYMELDERYTLIESIFTDTYMDLWAANDNKLNRLVMIKTIPPNNFKPIFEMIYRESLLLSRLSHPHILPIYDYRKGLNGYPFMVTPHLPETALSSFDTLKASPVLEILRLCQQIASAIDYIHDNKITHFDIAPQNIHMSADGFPFVGNFLTGLHG